MSIAGTGERGLAISLARLGRFVVRMCPPHVYACYGVLWALALEGSAVWLSAGPVPGAGDRWSVSWATAARAASVVAALVFFRMVDEQKDVEYDRVHHPDRPLVTGAVGAGELRAAMAAIVAAVVVANAAVSAVSVVLGLLPLGYAVGLAWLERVCTPLREGLVANLLVAYPGQALVGLYLYGSLASTGAITADWRVVPLLAMFAGVFLQFEFARKTEWHGEPGARLYSNLAGPIGAAAVALGLAGAAVALEAALFRPWSAGSGSAGDRSLLPAWLPVLALVFPVLGGWRFLGRRRSGALAAPALCFVFAFDLALVAQAAAR